MASRVQPRSMHGEMPLGFHHRSGCSVSSTYNRHPTNMVLGGKAAAEMLRHQASLLGPITGFVEWAVVLAHYRNLSVPAEFLKRQLNDYVHNVLQKAQVSHSTVIVALLYIHRFFAQGLHGDLCGPCLFVVALMTSYKYLEDLNKLMKEWVSACGLSHERLQSLERVFLRDLGFSLGVSPGEFDFWKELYEREPLVTWWRDQTHAPVKSKKPVIEKQTSILRQPIPRTSAVAFPHPPILLMVPVGDMASYIGPQNSARSAKPSFSLSHAAYPVSSEPVSAMGYGPLPPNNCLTLSMPVGSLPSLSPTNHALTPVLKGGMPLTSKAPNDSLRHSLRRDYQASPCAHAGFPTANRPPIRSGIGGNCSAHTITVEKQQQQEQQQQQQHYVVYDRMVPRVSIENNPAFLSQHQPKNAAQFYPELPLILKQRNAYTCEQEQIQKRSSGSGNVLKLFNRDRAGLGVQRSSMAPYASRSIDTISNYNNTSNIDNDYNNKENTYDTDANKDAASIPHLQHGYGIDGTHSNRKGSSHDVPFKTTNEFQNTQDDPNPNGATWRHNYCVYNCTQNTLTGTELQFEMEVVVPQDQTKSKPSRSQVSHNGKGQHFHVKLHETDNEHELHGGSRHGNKHMYGHGQENSGWGGRGGVGSGGWEDVNDWNRKTHLDDYGLMNNNSSRNIPYELEPHVSYSLFSHNMPPYDCFSSNFVTCNYQMERTNAKKYTERRGTRNSEVYYRLFPTVGVSTEYDRPVPHLLYACY